MAILPAESEAVFHARRCQQDLAKLLLLVLLSPFAMRKIAQEVCSLNTGNISQGYALQLCHHRGSAEGDGAAHGISAAYACMAKNYVRDYIHLLQLRGVYFWVPCTTWLHFGALVLGASLSPSAYSKIVLPLYSTAIATIIPQSLQLGLLLLTDEAPTPYNWDVIRFAPVFRLAFSLAFPVYPLLDAVNTLASHSLCLASIAIACSKHSSLQASWVQELLLTSGCMAVLVMVQLWRWQGYAMPAVFWAPTGGLGPGAAAVQHGKQKVGRTAPLPADPSSSSSAGGAPRAPMLLAPKPRIGAISRWADVLALLCPTALWPGRLAQQARGYQGFVQFMSVRLKLEGVEPEQLPAGWRERCAAEVAAQTHGGCSALGVYVRKGCIELELDLLLWGSRDSGTGSAAGGCGGNGSGRGGMVLGMHAPEACHDASSSSVFSAGGLDIDALVATLQLPQAPTSVEVTVAGAGSTAQTMATS